MNINLNQQLNNIYIPKEKKDITFGNKSVDLKRADDICRRVRLEFPLYSTSKIKLYKNIDKNEKTKNFQHFISQFMEEFRAYYIEGTPPKIQYYKEILGLKKNKIGNCGEITDATILALKMNGYNKVKKLSLYAYNPETNSAHKIDHCVAGLNITPKKGYKTFNPEKDKHVEKKHLIFPDENSIIIDSWAGFTDTPKNSELKYKTNNWCCNIQISEEDNTIHNIFQLKENEKIGYLIEEEPKFKPSDIKYYVSVFPGLVIKNPLGQKGEQPADLGLTWHIVNGIRMYNKIPLHKYSTPKDYNPKPIPKDTWLDKAIGFFNMIL